MPVPTPNVVDLFADPVLQGGIPRRVASGFFLAACGSIAVIASQAAR